MIEAINPNTLFNTIAMARQNTSSLILVPEGEDDSFVLGWHRNPDDLLLIQGRGRDINLRTAELVEQRALGGVRFLVDSDYDRFTNPGRTYPSNVFVSTTHDVIMDILLADVRTIDMVISAQCRSTGRSTARGGANEIDASAIREQSFELAANVARVRIINDRDALALFLSPFPFGTLSVDPPDLVEVCRMAIVRSETTCSADYLVEEITKDGSCREVSPLEAVGDHDLFRALARVLKENRIEITDKTLFTAFLAAITCGQLMRTDWHARISAWGRDNAKELFTCPCTAA